jgi:hypothetical protein
MFKNCIDTPEAPTGEHCKTVRGRTSMFVYCGAGDGRSRIHLAARAGKEKKEKAG